MKKGGTKKGRLKSKKFQNSKQTNEIADTAIITNISHPKRTYKQTQSMG